MRSGRRASRQGCLVPSPTSSMRRAMAYTAASASRFGPGSRRMPYQKLLRVGPRHLLAVPDGVASCRSAPARAGELAARRTPGVRRVRVAAQRVEPPARQVVQGGQASRREQPDRQPDAGPGAGARADGPLRSRSRVRSASNAISRAEPVVGHAGAAGRPRRSRTVPGPPAERRRGRAPRPRPGPARTRRAADPVQVASESATRSGVAQPAQVEHQLADGIGRQVAVARAGPRRSRTGGRSGPAGSPRSGDRTAREEGRIARPSTPAAA